MNVAIRAGALFVVAATISACSGPARTVSAIPASVQPGGTPAGSSAWSGRSFNELAGKRSVTDKQIDSYIDAGVVGKDREIARQLMKMMPSSKRGDFIYFDGPNHIVSNRSDLRANLTVQPAKPKQVAAAGQSRSTRGWPPAPFPGTGPYSRMYSKQGITGAVGYVSIACSAQQLNNGDEGYTYFESVDALDRKTEGGLEHIPGAGGRDGVIRPYFSDGTFQPLHNTFTYSCHDGPIGIMKGHLPTPSNQTFVLTGVPAQAPSTTYLDPNAVVWNKAVWNFFADSGNYHSAGTDASGLSTPCTQCYIEKMTTIAQHGLNADGSYFGIWYDQGGRAFLGIHWEQVEFGEIALPCQGQVANTPGTGKCSLAFQADSSRWLGDFQTYPDRYVAQEKSSNDLSPDPYETYAGIDLRNYQSPHAEDRSPMGAFTDPHPVVYQPPCTLDDMGLCAVAYGPYYRNTMCNDADSIQWNYTETTTDYYVYDSTGQRQPQFTYISNDPQPPCEPYGWMGSSPAQYFNDYALPQ